MQGCTHRSCMTPSARNTTHICVSFFFFYTVFADSTESYIQRGMDENNSKTKRWDSATIGERECVYTAHTHTHTHTKKKKKTESKNEEYLRRRDANTAFHNNRNKVLTTLLRTNKRKKKKRTQRNSMRGNV